LVQKRTQHNIEGIHPYDIGIIDKLGIAVRTLRATDYDFSIFRNNELLFFYNTKEEIDVMVEAVKRAALMLS
jgi:cysteine desulfurase/selenocysteine lyase